MSVYQHGDESMKAILIDPNMKSIARIDISTVARLGDYFGEKPQVAAKLPKGDVLYAGVEARAEAFILGGSRPIAGPGLIVGRRTGPGERGPALVRLDDVAALVRWTTVDVRPEPPATVQAILIDPEHGLIEEVAIAPNRLALVCLLGGDIGRICSCRGTTMCFHPLAARRRHGAGERTI
jgi:hypothetical protein